MAEQGEYTQGAAEPGNNDVVRAAVGGITNDVENKTAEDSQNSNTKDPKGKARPLARSRYLQRKPPSRKIKKKDYTKFLSAPLQWPGNQQLAERIPRLPGVVPGSGQWDRDSCGLKVKEDIFKYYLDEEDPLDGREFHNYLHRQYEALYLSPSERNLANAVSSSTGPGSVLHPRTTSAEQDIPDTEQNGLSQNTKNGDFQREKAEGREGYESSPFHPNSEIDVLSHQEMPLDKRLSVTSIGLGEGVNDNESDVVSAIAFRKESTSTPMFLDTDAVIDENAGWESTETDDVYSHGLERSLSVITTGGEDELMRTDSVSRPSSTKSTSFASASSELGQSNESELSVSTDLSGQASTRLQTPVPLLKSLSQLSSSTIASPASPPSSNSKRNLLQRNPSVGRFAVNSGRKSPSSPTSSARKTSKALSPSMKRSSSRLRRDFSSFGFGEDSTDNIEDEDDEVYPPGKSVLDLPPPIPGFFRKIREFWQQSLLCPVSVDERLGLRVTELGKPPGNIREFLQIDIYVARSLTKKLHVTTFKDLYEAFRIARLHGRLKKFQKVLKTASLTDTTLDSILAGISSCNYALEKNGVSEVMRAAGGSPPHSPDKNRRVTTQRRPPTQATQLQKMNDRARMSFDIESRVEREMRKREVKAAKALNAENDEELTPNHSPALKFPQEEVRPGSPSALSREALKDIDNATRLAVSKKSYVDECASLGLFPVPKLLKSMSTLQVNLSHFSLGRNAGAAISSALAANPSIQHLTLANNMICAPGGLALSRALDANISLVELNVSRNKIGPVAGEAIVSALARLGTIQYLSVAENDIDDRISDSLSKILSLQPQQLVYLDLSGNKVGDTTALVVAQGVYSPSGSLTSVNLSWNSIKSKGGRALAQALGANSTVFHCDISWNGIGDEGGLAFAETVALNDTLSSLSLSSNRLGQKTMYLLADAVNLNRTLDKLDLNHNPLGDLGVGLIMRAVFERTHSLRLGLEAVEALTSETDYKIRIYNRDQLAGTYCLELHDFWDHAVASLLLAHHQLQLGVIKGLTVEATPSSPSAAYSSVPVPASPNAFRFFPESGMLRFTFHENIEGAKASNKEEDSIPYCHFRLDLSVPADREMTRTLIDRAVREPGENWKHETLNGIAFDLVEGEEGYQWLDEHPDGILELDYVTTSLQLEAHYHLDMSKSMDSSVAWKLLERVQAAGRSSGVKSDQWRNIKVDGRPAHISQFIRRDGAAAAGDQSLKAKWRLPLRGILEFDFMTAHPQQVLCQHYRLDLSITQERKIAEDLILRARQRIGESWWNEKIEGITGIRSFMRKDGTTDGDPAIDTVRLPTRGVIEFDYIITRTREQARNMLMHPFRLNLSNVLQYEEAEILRKMVMEETHGSLWHNITLNEGPLVFPSSPLPRSGILDFSFVAFEARKPTSEKKFLSILKKLQETATEEHMLLFLRLMSRGLNPKSFRQNQGNLNLTALMDVNQHTHSFSCEQAIALMECFLDLTSRLDAYNILFDTIVCKHLSVGYGVRLRHSYRVQKEFQQRKEKEGQKKRLVQVVTALPVSLPKLL